MLPPRSGILAEAISMICRDTRKKEHVGMTASVCFLSNVLINTRIYNLSSVPQMTQFLLVDAIISSKTNPYSTSKKKKRSNGEVKNKTMSAILSFIWPPFLKQQSSILRYFCSLKIESGLAVSFSDVYFAVRGSLLYSWKGPSKMFCSKLAS